jgi:hypothetical protein
MSTIRELLFNSFRDRTTTKRTTMIMKGSSEDEETKKSINKLS